MQWLVKFMLSILLRKQYEYAYDSHVKMIANVHCNNESLILMHQTNIYSNDNKIYCKAALWWVAVTGYTKT